MGKTTCKVALKSYPLRSRSRTCPTGSTAVIKHEHISEGCSGDRLETTVSSVPNDVITELATSTDHVKKPRSKKRLKSNVGRLHSMIGSYIKTHQNCNELYEEPGSHSRPSGSSTITKRDQNSVDQPVQLQDISKTGTDVLPLVTTAVNPLVQLALDHNISACISREHVPNNPCVTTKQDAMQQLHPLRSSKLVEGGVKLSGGVPTASNSVVPSVKTGLVSPSQQLSMMCRNRKLSEIDLAKNESTRWQKQIGTNNLPSGGNNNPLATVKTDIGEKRKYTTEEMNTLLVKNQNGKPKVRNGPKYASSLHNKHPLSINLDQSKKRSEVPKKKAKKEKAPLPERSEIPKKKAKKEKAPPPEKRLKRHRTSMDRLSERIQRALTQRLFLINREPIVRDEIGAIRAGFVVLGSTGNVYNVTIGRLVTCTCPDHLKGNICKHIIFVMVRVLRQSSFSTHIIQAALLSSELEDIFKYVTEANDANVMANDQVRKAIVGGDDTQCEDNAGDKRKPIGDDDNCPVCFEMLKESSEAQLVWCELGCGKSLHKQCWTMWQSQGKSTCVYCRQVWPVKMKVTAAAGSKNVLVGREGYINAGHLQGQDAFRDNSTYYRGYGW